MKAPVVFFAYNRPHHTLRALESLSKCEGASDSVLHVFCDGPKSGATSEEIAAIEEVRRIVASRKWCGEVQVHASNYNKGLTSSITEGVSTMTDRFGKVIVLEDDLLIGSNFLSYCNSALEKYEHDERVMHIAGFNYPSRHKLPPLFFAPTVFVWGWATWKRAWDHFTLDADRLIGEIVSSNRVSSFNCNDRYPYFETLQRQQQGLINTWDICWSASVFVRQGFSLHPGKSLVRNIGTDGSGTHWTGSASKELPEPIHTDPVKEGWPEVQYDPMVVERLYRSVGDWNSPGWKHRMKSALKKFIG
jgi:hypothetical protein